MADVIVHDVVGLPLLARHVDGAERACDMVGLDPGDLDLVGVRRLEDRDDIGGRLGAARGEQRQVVTGGDEAVAQQPHDLFDAAVGGGRDRDPGRGKHRDAESVSGHRARGLPRRLQFRAYVPS